MAAGLNWDCTQVDSVQSPGRLQGAGSSQFSVPCCRNGSAGGTRAHACLLVPGLTAPVEASNTGPNLSLISVVKEPCEMCVCRVTSYRNRGESRLGWGLPPSRIVAASSCLCRGFRVPPEGPRL